MRILNRKGIITVKGVKIGNTYIKAKHFCFPIFNKGYTKFFSDNTEYFFVLEKRVFNYNVLKICKVSM